MVRRRPGGSPSRRNARLVKPVQSDNAGTAKAPRPAKFAKWLKARRIRAWAGEFARRPFDGRAAGGLPAGCHRCGCGPERTDGATCRPWVSTGSGIESRNSAADPSLASKERCV
jgi:hypothetical protein